MPKIETLASVLEGIADRPWDHALFIMGECPWKEDAATAVVSLDEAEDPEDDPPFAKEHGLTYAMGVQQAQDIVENLRQQIPQSRSSDLVRALNFYAKNDAFLNMDGK